MRRNGFKALAAEFAALKCDDLSNREAISNWTREIAELPADLRIGCPESLQVLLHELRILGLNVQFESRTDCVAMRLAPATSADIQDFAPSEIRKPETINYRTYLPEPRGLFCEATFGPESQPRRRLAAHIDLASPIVPILFRLGSQPIIARLLGLDSDLVEAIVQRETGIGPDGGFRPYDPEQPGDVLTGTDAIRHLLQKTAGELSGTHDGWVQSKIYLSPPDLRPLILLDSGNFATSDLNDHYRNVINRNNRLRKLRELNAPPVILSNEIRMLQQCVDCLQANRWVDNPIMGHANRPLSDALSMSLDRFAYNDGKPVDWSASARVIRDASLDDSIVQVPTAVFDELRCDASALLLMTNGMRFTACRPQRIDENVVRISQAVADAMQFSSGNKCELHRPITPAACEEARCLHSGEFSFDDVPFNDIPASNDLARIDEFVACIRSGTWLLLDGEREFLLAGSGSLTILPDEVKEQETFAANVLAVSKPPTPPKPTLEEVQEIIKGNWKPTCLFQMLRTEVEPDPKAGRVGGYPWLPAGTAWPTVGKKPLPFLAQFPLDEALAADALPIDVPSGSMLTIFWHDEWWELGASSAPAIFIHSTENLVRHEAPAVVRTDPLFQLTSDVRLQPPSWSEIEETIYLQFGRQSRRFITQVHDLYVKSVQPEASELSRVGGCAFWIQEPVDDFVAQLASTDDAELMFGDSGSLYVVGHSPHELFGLVQCY